MPLPENDSNTCGAVVGDDCGGDGDVAGLELVAGLAGRLEGEAATEDGDVLDEAAVTRFVPLDFDVAAVIMMIRTMTPPMPSSVFRIQWRFFLGGPPVGPSPGLSLDGCPSVMACSHLG